MVERIKQEGTSLYIINAIYMIDSHSLFLYLNYRYRYFLIYWYQHVARFPNSCGNLWNAHDLNVSEREIRILEHFLIVLTLVYFIIYFASDFRQTSEKNFAAVKEYLLIVEYPDAANLAKKTEKEKQVRRYQNYNPFYHF